MGLSSFFRNIYTLDTLDTRFTISSSIPYKTVIDSRDDPATSNAPAEQVRSKAQLSKWDTPEFYFYYIAFILAVPYMFWTAYDVSRRM